MRKEIGSFFADFSGKAVRLVLVNSAKKSTIFPRYTKLFVIYFHLINLSGISL